MRILPILAAATLALSVAATAQLPLQRQAREVAAERAEREVSQEGATVTVTGRTKRMTTILKTVLRPSGLDQLGRYEVPVCPGISGAPRGTENTLLRLIRENATANGVRLEKPGCKPNALALFVTTPHDLIRGLKKRSPGYFGLIAAPDFEKLATNSSAIRSWHVIETNGRNGELLDDFGGMNGEASSGYAKVVRNAQATRVSENTRQDILLGFAVVDTNATVGKTLQQLADVISMHLFLDLGQDAARSAGGNSILSLFEPREDGGVAPSGMSAFDQGVLKGTYALERNNYNAQFQRHRIAREIARKEARDAVAIPAEPED